MPRPPNPFRPGFAERPPALGGRSEVLAAGDEAVAVAAVDGRTPVPVMMVGPRGVGKTVLLDDISRRAGGRYGWPRVWVEANPAVDLDAALAREVALADQVVRETPLRRRMQLSEAVLRAQVLGIGGEVRLAARGDTQPTLGDLLAALADRGSGLVLVVDEAQAAPVAQFSALASTWQRAVAESLPLVTLVGGLPGLRRRATEAGLSLGYLERADWHELGLLSAVEAAQALAGGAAAGGRTMDAAAAEVLAAASGGYPYAVQVYGKHAWRASGAARRITRAHAEEALSPAQRELERNLYQARWSQSPPREQEYLRVVADLSGAGGPVSTRAVADHLGATPRALSTIRARLLERGTLVADGNALAFMVPGMGEWVRRHGSGL